MNEIEPHPEHDPEAHETGQRSQLRTLLADYELVLRYTLQKGLLVHERHIKLLSMGRDKLESGERLDPQLEFGLWESFRDLNRLIAPVSVATLRASEPKAARRATLAVGLGTLILLLLVLAAQGIWIVGESTSRTIVEESTLRFVLPLLYGALGASTYGLRRLSVELREHLRAPGSDVRNVLRVTMGCLAGMAIGWFFTPADIGVHVAALAFLAGYSVEIVFSGIDGFLKMFADRLRTSTHELLRSPIREELQDEVKALVDQKLRLEEGNIRERLGAQSIGSGKREAHHG